MKKSKKSNDKKKIVELKHNKFQWLIFCRTDIIFLENVQRRSQMKYYLAPMEGITGYVYRNAYAKSFHNIDKYFTPFIPAAKKMSKKNPFFWKEFGIFFNSSCVVEGQCVVGSVIYVSCLFNLFYCLLNAYIFIKYFQSI